MSFLIWLSIRSPCSNFRSGSWSWRWLLHVIRIEYYSLLISWYRSATLSSEWSYLISWNGFILNLEVMLSTQRLLLIVWTDASSATSNFLVRCTCLWYFKLLMVFNISISSNFVWPNAYIICKVGKVLRHWNQWDLWGYFLSRFSFLWFKLTSWYLGMRWWFRILSHSICNYLVNLICFSLVSWDIWVTWGMVWIEIVRRQGSRWLRFVTRLRYIGCWCLWRLI